MKIAKPLVLSGCLVFSQFMLSAHAEDKESKESVEEPEGRAGFFSIQGIGTGVSALVTDDEDKGGEWGPTLVIDSKIGGMFNDYFGLHLYTNLTIRDFDTIGKFYDWLFSHEEWLLLS